ncbi:MAG: diguanylate cyclase, partial [Planctomycetota bacterium]
MPEEPGRGAEDNRWEALLRVTRSWRLEWHTGELLERVAREAVELLDLERGIVFLTEGGELRARRVWPEPEPDSGSSLEAARDIAEQVVRTGRALFAHDVSSAGEEAGEDVGVICCVPLSSGQGVLGALYVDSRHSPEGLGRRDQELLEMLGLQAAAALEHMLLYRSAITDPLTGLFTHRYFQQQVDQEIRRARRLGSSVCLLLMDLDEFKGLNDTRGHEAGNQFLIRLAGAIRDAVRESDVVARFGGDEFELLLPETDAEGGRLVAEKVRETTLEANAPGDPRVSASLVVAAYPSNAEDAQGLFFCADESLYAAKDGGRDRVVVSDHARPDEPDPESRRGEPAQEPGRRKDSTRLELPPDLADRSAISRDAPEGADRAREQVDGHTVVRRLGSGSTGEVLLVSQPELDRPVALKRPHSANLTPEQAEAFEREARITASLRHPGVIPVHTMGTDSDGRRYYTMQPLQDLSLGDILERRRSGDRDFLRRYSQNALLEILHRVAETIAYAHQEKTAHLDLNPWNVMVGAFGEVMVIDWGEVTDASSSRGASGASGELALLAGSPRYAPPERITGGEVGFPADVHSLGTILYEVLTGKSPYLRSDTRSTLRALRQGEVIPPERAAPEAGLDPVLTELCVRALSSDPGTRPSALEFAQRLGRYLRREAEWEVVRFGPAEHPLVAEEWETVLGGWELREGEWVAAREAENVLIWRPRVPGNFRFVAEGWVEERGELALIGHGTRGRTAEPANTSAQEKSNPFLVLEQTGAFEGYCFEFGAEDNNCTKLARHGHDVMVVPAMRIEPGRRYRLEIEYQDGWLRCFVDDEQVFAYRELFPLAGSSIGFYSSGTGPRLRPIEVQRQGFALQPAMRMADDLYKHQFYKAAVERYVQIADQNPHRLEGDEARLKIGLCLAAQGEAEAARKTFRSLASGPLRPHALAEEAAVEFSDAEGTDPRRGLQLFAELLDRFPDSHARVRVVAVARKA